MKDLDWENLTFAYRKTDYNVRCYYRDGKWGEIEVCSDEYIKLHMAASCLHYGQEAFEGLKAYRCPDGKVRIFRVKDNAARLQSTCEGIVMPKVPTEMFEEMVKKVVRLNQDSSPPTRVEPRFTSVRCSSASLHRWASTLPRITSS